MLKNEVIKKIEKNTEECYKGSQGKKDLSE